MKLKSLQTTHMWPIYENYILANFLKRATWLTLKCVPTLTKFSYLKHTFVNFNLISKKWKCKWLEIRRQTTCRSVLCKSFNKTLQFRLHVHNLPIKQSHFEKDSKIVAMSLLWCVERTCFNVSSKTVRAAWQLPSQNAGVWFWSLRVFQSLVCVSRLNRCLFMWYSLDYKLTSLSVWVHKPIAMPNW